jgi:hypothetical protein
MTTLPKSEPVTNVSEVLRSIWKKPQKNNNETPTPQPMWVIGAGYGRTSTSSLRAALHRLGIHSYHMKHALIDHLDWWYEHATERLQGKPGKDFESLAHLLSHEGFNATVDDPNCFYFKEFMAMYPEALVVLTVRPTGQSGRGWSQSVLRTTGQIIDLFQRVPWRWFEPFIKLQLMHVWVRQEQLSRITIEDHYSLEDSMALAYDHWVEYVQATVPPDRLLVFAASDGWEPLCEFLAPLPNAQIPQRCQTILANDEPYPFVNDTTSFLTILGVFQKISYVFESLPVVIVPIVCWLMVLVVLWLRRWRRKKQPKKSKEM